MRHEQKGGFLFSLKMLSFSSFILSPSLSLSRFPPLFLSVLASVPVESDMNGDKEPDGSGAMNPD